MNLLWGWTA